jgi:hypothetical protein
VRTSFRHRESLALRLGSEHFVNRTNPNIFGYPGATPSISANGTSNGIVRAVENSNPASLHAYNTTNLAELYNGNQGANRRDQFGAGRACGTGYVGTAAPGCPLGEAQQFLEAITTSNRSKRIHKSLAP